MKLSATQILALGAVGIAGVVVWRTARAINNAVDAAAETVGEAADDLNQFPPFATHPLPGSFGSALFDFVQRLRGIPPYDPNDNALSTNKLQESVTS